MALKERLEAAREDYRALSVDTGGVLRGASSQRMVGSSQDDDPQSTDGIFDGTVDPDGAPGSPRSRPGVRLVAVAAVVVVAVGVVGAAGLVFGGAPWSDDDRTQPVEAVPPTTLAKSNDPNPPGAIARYSPDIVLEPAGPYSDGETITVSVPEGFAEDFANGGARLCAVLADGPDGPGEWCDQWNATWAGPGSYTSTSVRLSRMVFTPTGNRDCEEPEVTCRLIVRSASGVDEPSGPEFASEVLRFEAAIEANPSEPDRGEVRLTAGATPGAAELELMGVEPDPSWLKLREEDPVRAATFPPFSVQVCAFGEATQPEDPWGSNLWLTSAIGATEGRIAIDDVPRLVPGPNCVWYAQAPMIDPDAPTTVTLPTWVLGYEGWSDCREDHCFIGISRSVVHDMLEDGGLSGSEVRSAIELISPHLVDPDGVRPELEVLTPGPHVAGQEVEVEVSNLPAGRTTSIGVCYVEDPWGCGYLGWAPPSTAVSAFGPGGALGPAGFADGVHTITLPENFACITRCYLELDSQGEGMPPLATAALDPG
ncbi:MAG: hypothetical protein ACK5O2_10270 [Microthrixaceae bacterium]